MLRGESTAGLEVDDQHRGAVADESSSVSAAPAGGFSPVDAVFLVAIAVTIRDLLPPTRGTFFWADDWPMALRGRTPGDFLEPYNGHLSIVPIAVWRASYAVFGFGTYVPLRLVGLLSLVGISVAIFVVFRTRTGPLVAGVAATSILWYRGTSLEAVAFNHYLVLVAAVVCAYALTQRGRNSDWAVAILLTFALSSAGGGVAVAAACVVHAACTRPGRARWLAVGVPSVIWLVWWVAYARHASELPEQLRLSTGQTVHAVYDGVRASFDGLAFGSRVGGIVLGVLFLAHLLWRLQQGLRASAIALAWSAALIVWWVGLAFNRAVLLDPETFRYQMFGSVMVLLALLPPAPIVRMRAWRTPVAALALAAFVAVLALANHGPTVDAAHLQRQFASFGKQQMIVANQGRAAVPDAYHYGISLGYRSAREYREAVRLYGTPAHTDPRAPIWRSCSAAASGPYRSGAVRGARSRLTSPPSRRTQRCRWCQARPPSM